MICVEQCPLLISPQAHSTILGYKPQEFDLFILPVHLNSCVLCWEFPLPQVWQKADIPHLCCCPVFFEELTFSYKNVKNKNKLPISNGKL